MQYLITRAWKCSSSMKSFSEDSTLQPTIRREGTMTCFTGIQATICVVAMDASTHLNSKNQ
jgi:hypothetical protein